MLQRLATTRMLHACALVMTLASTSLAHAETHFVRAGSDWTSLASRVRAGDEILLGEGVHRSVVLERMIGDAQHPITIRPQAAQGLVEIAPDREAIKLVDCAYVRIERIAVHKARRAGIVVEGTTAHSSHHISILDVLVTQSQGLAEEAGIVAREVDGLTVQRVRVENCAGAGVHLEHCARAELEALQIFVRGENTARFGFNLVGTQESITISKSLLRGRIESAISIGCEASPRAGAVIAPFAAPSSATNAKPDSTSTRVAAPTLTTLAHAIICADIRIEGATRALDVGSCDEVTFRAVTIVDAHEEAYRISVPPPRCAPARVRFCDNLIVWKPDAMRRLGVVADGADAQGFTLGANLWWSTRFPATGEVLGTNAPRFPGKITVPQTIDIDPNLDERLLPRTPSAKLFGANV